MYRLCFSCLGLFFRLVGVHLDFSLKGDELTFFVAWMLASFLSLPAKPHLTPPGSSTTPNIAHDIEKALDPIDQAQYESARWWRNVNRIMSVMGLLIIIAIVSLLISDCMLSS